MRLNFSKKDFVEGVVNKPIIYELVDALITTSPNSEARAELVDGLSLFWSDIATPMFRNMSNIPNINVQISKWGKDILNMATFFEGTEKEMFLDVFSLERIFDISIVEKAFYAVDKKDEKVFFIDGKERLKYI